MSADIRPPVHFITAASCHVPLKLLLRLSFIHTHRTTFAEKETHLQIHQKVKSNSSSSEPAVFH